MIRFTCSLSLACTEEAFLFPQRASERDRSDLLSPSTAVLFCKRLVYGGLTPPHLHQSKEGPPALAYNGALGVAPPPQKNQARVRTRTGICQGRRQQKIAKAHTAEKS